MSRQRVEYARRFLFALVLGILTNYLVAWCVGYLQIGATRASQVTNVDCGADTADVGLYTQRGLVRLYWQPQTAQDWYFSPNRLDQNKYPRPRPRERALDLPWKFAAMPEWVPNWAEFDSLQTSSRRVEEVWVMGAGWLFIAVHCRFVDLELWGRIPRMTYTVEGGIPLPNKVMRWKGGGATFLTAALPLRPVWPGFLLNTALYASVWFLLLGVGAAQRRLRRTKGNCPACGYDLRALSGAICPECGQTPP